MGNRQGAILLEAVWLIPFIICLLMGVVLLEVQLLDFCWSTQQMLRLIREESLAWIGPQEGLYWDASDLLLEGGGTEVVPMDGFTNVSKERFNEMGVRFGLEGTVTKDFSYGPLKLTYQCRLRDTSVLPTYQLRTAKLIEDEILPELMKMIERNEESPINKKEVYVVDTSTKEHDYLKVYHLQKDCQYVRKKSFQTMSTQQAMDAGYRPCLICLKKEIAKSYKDLL